MVDVSVIIPVYNTARWLPACLASVLGQTLSSLEVLCIDDCSTDDSAAVVARYAERDPRVVLVRLPSRVSTGAVRNVGLDRARGRFVAFLDSDDLYPNRDVLMKLKQSLLSSACSVAVGYAVYFSKEDASDARLSTVAIGYSGPSGVVDYRSWQDVRGFCTCLYDRAFLDANGLRFPPITRNEDPVFFLRTLLAARTFAALGECTYLYRVNHKRVDLRADGYRFAKEHAGGLVDMMSRARENGLDKLEAQMARELASTVDSLACFRAMPPEVHEAFSSMVRSTSLTAGDWLFIFRWMVRLESKARRVLFAFRLFGFKKAMVVLGQLLRGGKGGA